MLPRLLICLLLFVTPPLAAERLNLVANTWPPYVDDRLPEDGLAMELVRHIYQRAGYSADIEVENWSDAMEGVQAGAFDALAAAWHSREREAIYRYSRPYLVNELKLVTLRKREGEVRVIGDLAGTRLGVLRDYAYGVDFSVIDGLHLVEENYLVQNLLNLLNGEVDFVIGDERSIAQQMQEYLTNRVGDIRYLELELPSRSLYIAAGREGSRSEAMVEDFNRALMQTLNDGSYRRIVESWDVRYGLQR